MNEFVLPVPGINYADNKLYVFGKRRILVVKIDDHGPRAWKKTIKEPEFRASFIPSSMGTEAVRRLNTIAEHADTTSWRVKTEMAFLNANVDRTIIDAMENSKSMCIGSARSPCARRAGSN